MTTELWHAREILVDIWHRPDMKGPGAAAGVREKLRQAVCVIDDVIETLPYVTSSRNASGGI